MTQSHVEHHDPLAEEAIEPPLSITRLFRALHAYRGVIVLALLVVGVGYTIVGLTLYLLTPADRVTTVRFRLNFQGAELGTYPNGVKFSAADIISTPILNQVFQENALQRFTDINDFTRAIVVLESNPAYETLAAEYNARLADPRLTPVDRERIQREWDAKRTSLSKSEYAISFVRPSRMTTVPETVARKVLSDILRRWAQVATTEQHVLQYPVAVISPAILAPAPAERQNLVAATQVLRTRIRNVLSNVEELQRLPGAELVRSKRTQSSLREIQLRLEDQLRFRLDPLVRDLVRSLPDRGAATEFLEAQKEYDQQRLDGFETQAAAIRDALAMYSLQDRALVTGSEQMPAETRQPLQQGQPPQTEAVMPQLSDTFIDRLVELTSRSSGLDYRQKLVDEYRSVTTLLIPAQQDVQYDDQVLTELRKPSSGPARDAAAVARDIDAIRADVAAMIGEVTEIHAIMSRNRNPATELFTTTGVPTASVERAGDLKRLLLVGVLTFLVAIPLIIAGVLIHYRYRIEERDAAEAAA